MDLSKLILGVIAVMTIAVQSMASDNKTNSHEADTSASEIISEVSIDIEIAFGFSVSPKRDDEKLSVVPTHFDVGQNYPNPFNATTTIEFDLPNESGVFATVYNILGRRIRILNNNTRSPGSYQVEWDGMTDFGQPATSGVYFFVLLSDDNYAIRKMLLLK